jgi:hypothetical protein
MYPEAAQTYVNGTDGKQVWDDARRCTEQRSRPVPEVPAPVDYKHLLTRISILAGDWCCTNWKRRAGLEPGTCRPQRAALPRAPIRRLHMPPSSPPYFLSRSSIPRTESVSEGVRFSRRNPKKLNAVGIMLWRLEPLTARRTRPKMQRRQFRLRARRNTTGTAGQRVRRSRRAR